jgi:hypothetical protein
LHTQKNKTLFGLKVLQGKDSIIISEKVEERVIRTKKEKLGVALEENQSGASVHGE